MSKYFDKPMSLLEKKKQQWAKEREEMARLGAPWGSANGKDYFDTQIGSRTKHLFGVPALGSCNSFSKKNGNSTPRRSSLPPLYKNQYNSNEKCDRDFGGETSGYGSDNANVSPEYPQNTINWHHTGYESSSSLRDDRPKWNEKMLACGKTNTSEPPGWLKRGLESDAEIVVSNMSPAESPQQDCNEFERPSTNSSNGGTSRSFVRGQRTPLNQTDVIERERRRQAALDHQEAIKKQLEEREQKRKEEKEKKIREEYEEELRIERDQEIERKRREQEMLLLEEKKERERKRKKAIQEAIEVAEKEARLEKMKLKNTKLLKNSSVNLLECIVEKEKTPRCKADITVSKIVPSEAHTSNIIESENNTNKNANHIIQNDLEKINNLENESNQLQNNTKFVNITSQGETLNTNDLTILQENIKAECKSKQENLAQTKNNNINLTTQTPISRNESVAMLLQSNLENYQTMQYALLVPSVNPTTHVAIPIAVPMPITIDKTLQSSTRTENRVLTPTVLRNRQKNLSDSSTQTEYTDFIRIDQSEPNLNKETYLREKLHNLELSYDTRSSRRERRSRNEDVNREQIVERPKWGANRPPTRYVKQSEKDPLYQRKKLRQRLRGNKLYDDKNSSDESQSATPRSYCKNGYVEKRHTRALWSKAGDHLFARNIRMYQTEIFPLESDKDSIIYKQNLTECCCHCKCDTKYCENVKVNTSNVENTSPSERETVQYKRETIKQDFTDCKANAECVETNLEKNSTLQESILLKEEPWNNNSSRVATLVSSAKFPRNS